MRDPMEMELEDRPLQLASIKGEEIEEIAHKGLRGGPCTCVFPIFILFVKKKNLKKIFASIFLRKEKINEKIDINLIIFFIHRALGPNRR